MASYYKYKSREGQDQVDWRTITKGITDEITRVKGDRNKKRKDIQDAALVTYENLANKPQGPDVLENKNIASYAAQQEAMAREDLAMLRSGDITLQQYTSRSNTAQGGTKRLFNLSKKYQANVQAQLDSLKPDENGIIQGSGMNAIYKQMVERFADPSNSMYYVDPETRESFLAIVTDKEGDDVVKINDKAYSLMGVSAAEDIILRNDARYQSNSVSALLAKETGAFIEVLREGDVETREDAYARMFDGKELTADGKAIMSQIKATFASDNDYSSMLFDTLGYVPVAENENGEGFTNLQTKEIIDELPDNSFLVKTVNGRQVPQIDDTLKDAAHRGVLAQIKSKLDIKETATIDKTQGEDQAEGRAIQWEKLKLEKSKFNKDEADKATDLDTKREVVSTLYGGTREDINSALSYYSNYGGTSKIQKVDRSDSGIEVTYENDNGDMITTPVSFYVPDETAKTMMPNPDYDPNKEEDAVNNPKQIKGRLKTEAQFIQSASQLLIGESLAEGLDATLKDGSLKYNRPFTSTPGMSVENVVTKAEVAEDISDTFKVSNSKYLGEILNDVNLMDEDSEVAGKIPGLLKDLGIEANAVGSGASDEVLVTIPGYNKTFKLQTDFGLNAFLGLPATNRKNKAGGSKAAQTKERMRFRLYLEEFLNSRPDISKELNLEIDPKKKGRFNKYNNN
jgi:hypothetical protein